MIRKLAPSIYIKWNYNILFNQIEKAGGGKDDSSRPNLASIQIERLRLYNERKTTNQGSIPAGSTIFHPYAYTHDNYRYVKFSYLDPKTPDRNTLNPDYTVSVNKLVDNYVLPESDFYALFGEEPPVHTIDV